MIVGLWEKSGIYKITNPINGKLYIGSAKNLSSRWAAHRRTLLGDVHKNIHLQRAFNKLDDEFTYEVIEFCDISNLVIREQHYLDTLRPAYNIDRIASSSLGVKRSPETVEKIRKATTGRKQSQETIDKRIASLTGKKRSPEIRLKYSISKMGDKNPCHKWGWDKQVEAMRKHNTGKTRSQFVKDRISETHSKPVIQLSLDGDFIKEWKSGLSAAKGLGIHDGDINSVCSGRLRAGYQRKTAGGFKWKFKSDYI